jgi:hypothetical protein
MKCNYCPLKYVGQTGGNFRTRYREHIQAIRYNKSNSKYSEHILDTQHTYRTIENTMDMLNIEKKGPILNTSERLYIHNISKDKLQIEDTHTSTNNTIFNVIRNYYTKKTTRQQHRLTSLHPTTHSPPHPHLNLYKLHTHSTLDAKQHNNGDEHTRHNQR